ncbi:MAG TPA: formimidoylglutamate deiminase [Rhabdaerophilum sp.]|nr:formimidoylglutamate deiminase [Rhabdaerophilum sp.]
MTRFFFRSAMLPAGWAQNVAVRVAEGAIATVEADAKPAAGDITGLLALPGLASLHSHTFQRGMAGLAEVRGPGEDSFWSWRQVMYRFLGLLGPDEVEAIAAQAFMEMLEGGFTAVGEFHYLHHAPDGTPYDNVGELSTRIAAAAGETGIGLTLLPVLYQQGGFGGAAPNEGQKRFLNSIDRYEALFEAAAKAAQPLPDANIGIAPHSLRAVSPQALSEIVTCHPRGPVHIHIAEQVREVEDCMAWSGRRPVEWLGDHIALGQRWCLVHATHMTPHEGRMVARSGAVAGLCPLTEANLGDGIFDAPTMRENGGAFGIGTDSNIQITAAGELRQLEYSQRLALRARNVFPRGAGASTGEALYRGALAGGAQALDRKIGGIEPGQRADFVVLGRDVSEAPVDDPASMLDYYVFVADARLVADVYVGGVLRVRQGHHIAREAIAARYRRVLQRLREN